MRGEDPLPRKMNDRVAYLVVFMVRHPKRQLQYSSTPIAVSGSGYTGKLTNSLKQSSICKSASRTVLRRMQRTYHATRRTPHGASRLFFYLCYFLSSGGWAKIQLKPTTLPCSNLVPCVNLTHSSRCNIKNKLLLPLPLVHVDPT